jgi:predicted molibdopterin-dependent oxidoreductase YjgC
VLLVTDPLPLDLVAAIASKGGLSGKAGGVLPLPEAPNELGVRAAGFRDDPLTVLERAERGELRMLVLLGDRDVVSSGPLAERWRMAITRVESVVVGCMFPNEAALWANVILPATAALEKEGTTTNLEGRVQRLRPALAPPDGVVSELELLGAVARRLDRERPPHAAAVHRRLAAAEPAAFPGWEASAAPIAPGRTGEVGRARALRAPKAPRSTPGALQLVAYRPLISGPAAERSERLRFLRPDAILLAPADAARLGLTEGQTVTVSHAAGTVQGPLQVSRTIAEGAVRVPWSGPDVAGTATIEAGA